MPLIFGPVARGRRFRISGYSFHSSAKIFKITLGDERCDVRSYSYCAAKACFVSITRRIEPNNSSDVKGF